MIRTIAILALAPLLLVSSPAAALDILNDHDEPAKIVIERWVQFVGPRKEARFRPFESPTRIKIELSHVRLECHAEENDQVRLAENNCYVNDKLAGEGQFRM